jgi:hypothetical protein
MNARRIPTSLLFAALLGPAACGGSSPKPPTPARLEAASPVSQIANQGTTVASPPAVRVVDTAGLPAAGVSVTFAVTAGGGSVTGSPAVSGADGVARIAAWTVGPAGPQSVEASAAAVPGGPVVFSATSQAVVTPEAASIEAASLTPQSAQAGHAVSDPPAVLVLDASGKAVAGTLVTFEVVSGGGTLTGASVASGTNGIARAGSWTLGGSGPQQVQAIATGLAGSPVAFDANIRTTTYDIGLRFTTGASTTQRLAFQRARERIEQIVTGDVPDVALSMTAAEVNSTCGISSAVSETIDDLMILVKLAPIDGAGNILGQAGPCVIRNSGRLPILGVMQFDTADLATLESRGQLEEVILHEMLHVVGLGSLWEPPLLAGKGGVDPTFTGAHALDAFVNLNNGNFYPNAKIPVENSGGAGTRDSHWRESVFVNELMTGWLSGKTQPLSATTAASLWDMGYAVDLAKADPFDLATATDSLRLAALRADLPDLPYGDDVLRLPIVSVDENGTPVR